MKKRQFFYYERKIREFSSPEKIFQYFASQMDDHGNSFMNLHDLIAACCNLLPSSEAGSPLRSGHLPGEPISEGYNTEAFTKRVPKILLDIVDEDNDGKISFQEFCVFQALRSFPPADLRAIFLMMDEDRSGYVSVDEFKQVFDMMLSAGRRAHPGALALRSGLKVDTDDLGTYNSLLRYLFGPKLKKQLSVNDFVKFIEDLDRAVLKMEFAHYDFDGNGTVSGEDFAKAVIANANQRILDKGLQRLPSLPKTLKETRISEQDFANWGKVCFHHAEITNGFGFFQQLKGVINKEDFMRGIQGITGIRLSQAAMDVVFFVIDLDGSGCLHYEEIESVLQSRLARSHRKIRQSNAGRFREVLGL